MIHTTVLLHITRTLIHGIVIRCRDDGDLVVSLLKPRFFKGLFRPVRGMRQQSMFPHGSSSGGRCRGCGVPLTLVTPSTMLGPMFLSCRLFRLLLTSTVIIHVNGKTNGGIGR